MLNDHPLTLCHAALKMAFAWEYVLSGKQAVGSVQDQDLREREPARAYVLAWALNTDAVVYEADRLGVGKTLGVESVAVVLGESVAGRLGGEQVADVVVESVAG